MKAESGGRKTLLAVLGAGVIGVFAGIGIGRSMSKPPVEAPSPAGVAKPVVVSALGGSGDLASLGKALKKASGKPEELGLLMAGIDSSDLPALVATAWKLNNRGYPEDFQVASALMRRWAAADPEAAFAFALGVSSATSRTMALAGFATGLEESALADPQRWLSQVSRPSVRAQLATGLFQALGMSDPERAFRFRMDNAGVFAIQENGSSSSSAGLWTRDFGESWQARPQRALAKLAAIDPSAAARLLDEVTGQHRREAMQSVATQWGKRDPAAAMAWVDELGEHEQRSARGSVLAGMFGGDLESARAQVRATDVSLLSRESIKSVFQSWAGADMAGALGWIEGLPPALQRHALQGMGPHGGGVVAGYDHEQLLDWHAQHPDIPGADSIALAGLLSMVSDDSERAMARILDLPHGPLRESATTSMVNYLAASDPQAALAFVDSLDDPAAQSTAREGIARHWGRSDLEGALAWATTLEDGRTEAIANAMSSGAQGLGLAESMELLASVEGLSEAERGKSTIDLVSSLSRQEPTAARAAFDLAWFDDTDLANAAQQAAGSIARALAREEPRSAMDWAGELPTEARSNAMARVMSEWAEAAPGEASEWLAAAELGDARDQIVASFAQRVVRSDPEAAFHWTVSMDAPQRSDLQLRQALQNWAKFDSAAAEAALEGAALEEDQRDSLRTVFASE